MKTIRRVLLKGGIYSLILLVLFLVYGNREGLSKENQLLFVTGGIGGSWYAGGAIVAEGFETNVPGIKTTVAPGGAVANISRIDQGEADVGFGSMTLAKSALDGIEPYTKLHKNVRSIANWGAPDLYQFAIVRKAGIGSFKDIIDKKFPLRFCAGTRGQFTELTNRRVFGEYGINYDMIKKWGGNVQFTSWTEVVSLISDGHADALGVQGPLKMAWLTELCLTREITFLGIDENVRRKMVDKFGMGLGNVPSKTYKGIESDIPSITDFALLLCRADLTEDFVYNLTKALFKVRQRLQTAIPGTYGKFEPETACKNTGFPLHPGAARYFKEMGYLK